MTTEQIKALHHILEKTSVCYPAPTLLGQNAPAGFITGSLNMDSVILGHWGRAQFPEEESCYELGELYQIHLSCHAPNEYAAWHWGCRH